jgi:putative phage-type endonuclease|tara:strand:- start:2560 stop:3717 length:1158 start_codon:yes stop_codon:yes gene_type:complete
MDSYIEEIRSICDPIITNFDTSMKVLIEYVMLILSLSRDRAFCKKNVYDGIVKQLICTLYKDVFVGEYDSFTIHDNSHIVDYLKTIPQFEQRTPEWFKMKEDSIGASESAIVFGKSIFSNRKKLLLKKSGHKEKWVQNAACQHGTKYEPIVQLLYQIKNNTTLYEFGSIVHSKYPMISASPDGITETGVMVEIKVPYKRIIKGIPPVYYWYQMQQQMEVCNLDRVDFVECKISEYFNKQIFTADQNTDSNGVIDPNDYHNRDGNIKNVIIEFFKKDATGRMTTDWIYPDKFLKLDEIVEWVAKHRGILDSDPGRVFSRDIYYKIDIYSCYPVWRDKLWWKDNYHEFLNFWKEVEHYRIIGNESLLNKRISKKRAPKYLIMDDDDD